MIGFKPNDYVEPEKKRPRHEADFSQFRNERLNLESTEIRDAFSRYNRNHRSL